MVESCVHMKGRWRDDGWYTSIVMKEWKLKSYFSPSMTLRTRFRSNCSILLRSYLKNRDLFKDIMHFVWALTAAQTSDQRNHPPPQDFTPNILNPYSPQVPPSPSQDTETKPDASISISSHSPNIETLRPSKPQIRTFLTDDILQELTIAALRHMYGCNHIFHSALHRVLRVIPKIPPSARKYHVQVYHPDRLQSTFFHVRISSRETCTAVLTFDLVLGLWSWYWYKVHLEFGGRRWEARFCIIIG